MKIATGLVIVAAAVAVAAAWRTEIVDSLSPYATTALQTVGLAAPAAAPAAGGGDGDAPQAAPGTARRHGGAAAGGDTGAGQAAASAAGDAGQGRRRGGGGPVAVTTATATREDMAIMRRTIGTVYTDANLDVTSETQGLVSDIVAKEGADVKAGDLILRLDSRIAEATVAKDRAALARDRASLDLARTTMARQEKLSNTAAVSQQALEDARAQVATAEGTVGVDEAMLESDLVTLSQKEIRAPFDGRLGAFNVTVGSLVQTATAIVKLTRLEPLQASFALPERDAAAVQAALAGGQPITVEVKPLGGDRSFTGRVDFMDVNVDATSGSFLAKATLAGVNGALIPGQSLDVAVRLGTLSVVGVPQVAVQAAQNGLVVYTVGSDGTVAVKPVTVALSDSGRSGVIAGLDDGDKVVVEGQGRLTPGAKVVEAGAGGGNGAVRVSDASKAEATP